MPTGYTADVADGKTTDFAAFVMNCARAFGALIELRDSPEAEIPESFAPSMYHQEAFDRAVGALRELADVDAEEAERRADADYDENMRLWAEGKRKREETRRRYRSMLDRVNAWQPPTREHIGLRDFMRQQLEESIRFDCDHDDERWIPKRRTGKQWLKEQRQRSNESREYHRAEMSKERDRSLERSAWVKELRRSLSEATTEPATR